MKRVKSKSNNSSLSARFCKCLKKLEPRLKAAAIPICTKSVFISRGLKRGKFNCRKTKKVFYKKNKTRSRS